MRGVLSASTPRQGEGRCLARHGTCQRPTVLKVNALDKATWRAVFRADVGVQGMR